LELKFSTKKVRLEETQRADILRMLTMGADELSEVVMKMEMEMCKTVANET